MIFRGLVYLNLYVSVCVTVSDWGVYVSVPDWMGPRSVCECDRIMWVSLCAYNMSEWVLPLHGSGCLMIWWRKGCVTWRVPYKMKVKHHGIIAKSDCNQTSYHVMSTNQLFQDFEIEAHDCLIFDNFRFISKENLTKFLIWGSRNAGKVAVVFEIWGFGGSIMKLLIKNVWI